MDSLDAHYLTHWVRNEMHIRLTSRFIPEGTFRYEGFDTTPLVRRKVD